MDLATILTVQGSVSSGKDEWSKPPLVPSRSSRFSSSDHLAAIRVQHLSRHVGRILASQEEMAGGNLIGLTWATQRNMLSELSHLIGAEACGNEWRPDRSRRNAIDADAILGELFCQ